VGDNDIGDNRNAVKSTTISMAMAMQGTTRGASPDGAHPGLHLKPMDATIGQVLALHCHGSRYGQRFRIKHTKH